MKTARFANVVAKAGKPDVHLALIDPARDRSLQAAVKAQRVMTVFQNAAGGKTDRGEVGFKPGGGRQYLVFPKSLKAFAGSGIVGIKYDLLDQRELPKSERAAPARPPRKKEKPKPRAKAAKDLPKHSPRPAPPRKVVPFHKAPEDDEKDEDEENNEDSGDVAELKKKIRHAMQLLEDGKAVAAFNLLKRAVGD